MAYAPAYYGDGLIVAIGQLNAITRQVQVGEAVSPGQPGYRDTDNKWRISEAGDTQAKAVVECIFLTPAAADGFSVALTSGLVEPDFTLVQSAAYYLSPTKGEMVRETDLVTGDWVTLIGFAVDTQFLDFAPVVTEKQIP
jgi:hypothetical protein